MTENKFMQALQSRKVWAALIGLIFILVNAALNQEQIDPDTVTNAVMIIISAYIGATAWEDSSRNQAAGNIAAAETAATQTTVSTPGTSNVEVTQTDTGTPPQPRVGMTGLGRD